MAFEHAGAPRTCKVVHFYHFGVEDSKHCSANRTDLVKQNVTLPVIDRRSGSCHYCLPPIVAVLRVVQTDRGAPSSAVASAWPHIQSNEKRSRFEVSSP